MLDFAMTPPEVASARMYSGPGSAPMMAAAAGWDALTSQLDSFAFGYSSVIAELHDDVWTGAASTAMVAAATPYVAWAIATATLTGQAAGQARAAAAAYETAFAATVPPAVVAANRAQLATLVATNFFGQNTPMIAATEAAYALMWAQDAAAMYGYAASASVATELAPFQQPPRTTNPAAPPGQAAPAQAGGTSVAGQLAGNSHAGVSQLMSTVPQQLSALSAAEPVAASGALAPSALGVVHSFNTLTHPIVLLAQAWRTFGNAGSYILAMSAAAGAPAAPPAAAAGLAGTGAPTAVLASAGEAAPVGRLSVPAGWPTTTPAPGAAAPPAPLPVTHPRDVVQGPARSATTRRATVPPAGIGPMGGMAPRRTGNKVFRMRQDRRFRMPRPAVGG